MKKLPLLLFSLLFFVFAAIPALSELHESLTRQYGMSDGEANAFEQVLAPLQSSLSEEQLTELLAQYLKHRESPAPGTISGDRYTHPLGFSFQIPANWTLIENMLGTTAMLIGVRNESGYAPTISIHALPGQTLPGGLPATDQMEAIYRQMLPNFQLVQTDDFEYLGVPARETVCAHGASEDAIWMQYQLLFEKMGNTYLLTLTTLSEEAAHESATAVYDAFTKGFTVDAAVLVPVPTASPTQPPQGVQPTSVPPAGSQGNG